jgi:hypothetical protein
MLAREHCGLRRLLLENVPGIFSSRGGADFAAVLNEILGTDFDVPKGGLAATLVAPRPQPNRTGAGGATPLHLLDNTGLNLCGAGEWLVEKHGARSRRH